MCFLGGGQPRLSGIKGLFKVIVGIANKFGDGSGFMRAHCRVRVSSGKHCFINCTQVLLDYELKEVLRCSWAPSLRLAATPLNVQLGPATSDLLYLVLEGSFNKGFLTACQWWDIIRHRRISHIFLGIFLVELSINSSLFTCEGLIFPSEKSLSYLFSNSFVRSLIMGSKSEIKT